MIKIKFIYIFLLGLSLTSCESYFGDDSNVDPDNPTDVTVDVLLPQIQARMAYTYGGDFTRYAGIYTHHIDGVNRQFVVYQNYGLVNGDVDNMWNNIYSGTLNSNEQMIARAEESGANHMVGVGLLLESFTIMMATDAWGDIPYSDAFKFAENGVYSPSFDAQEDIYNQILANISEARTLLSGDDGGVPISGDLMYNGDASKWIKLSNVLEARAYLHLSEVNGDAYANVLTALNRGGFESSADDFGFQFGTAATENAPFYQYIEQRDDCEVGADYVSLMESLGDPRISVFGAPHDVPGHPFFIPDQFLQLISYTEQEFMRAEALEATGGDSQDALETAVMSSMNEVGVASADADAYISSSAVANADLETIMTQKYIALYTNPEVWTDWRRKGLPNLEPNAGTEIPVRLPYSLAEQLSNTNTPTPATYTVYDEVWWDK